MNILLHLFQWLAATPLGLLIRDSTWGFAIVEMVHLVALAILGGVILVLDLRLLGWGVAVTPQRLSRDLWPWFGWSLVVMIASGIALTSGEALKCYYHPAFRWKMALLAAAILFYFTVHRHVVRDHAPAGRASARITAAISLALWLGVGVAGRAIGLV